MPRAAGMRTAGRLIQKAGQDRRRSKAGYVKKNQKCLFQFGSEIVLF